MVRNAVHAWVGGIIDKNAQKPGSVGERVRCENGSRDRGVSKSLDDGGIGHATAFAHRLKTQALSVGGERAQQGGH